MSPNCGGLFMFRLFYSGFFLPKFMCFFKGFFLVKFSGFLSDRVPSLCWHHF